jgi:hypothetical protein
VTLVVAVERLLAAGIVLRNPGSLDRSTVDDAVFAWGSAGVRCPV